MQQHNDDSEELGVDVNRMLRALPRERQPDPALEESIAQQLRRRRLLVAGARQARVQRQRGGVAVTWPAAAAAALLLFASGVVVGASSGRKDAPEIVVIPAGNSVAGSSAPVRAGDLLLASDKNSSVTRAIKF